MSVKKIGIDDIKNNLQRLDEDYKVFVPQMMDETIKFGAFDENSELVLDKDTDFSAKDVLYPQRETLFEYKKEKKSVELIESEIEDEQLLIFGLRTCDMSAIESLVPLFTWGDYRDEFWLKRREKLTTVVILCENKLRDTCFCKSVGIDPSECENADIVTIVDDDCLTFKSQTDRGEAILDDLDLSDGEWRDIEYDDEDEPLPIQGKEDELLERFEDDLWKWVAPECIGCGICTFVCPTCYCFDIQDEGEERIRFWDYCTGEVFTRMLAHQPRPTQHRRYRQRIMHKFSYYPRIFDGIISCVGCGRCIDLCPQNIDLREVLRKVSKSG